MNELEALGEALVELEEKRTLGLTREILARGDETPGAVLNVCLHSMKLVGERYQRGEYYLSALILAGEIFRQILDLVQPKEDETPAGEPVGRILLGTVAGDIHDLGKNMFATTLRGFGFSVIDAGVDVPKERFLQETRESRPDIICLSGLITAAFRSMKTTVEFLRADEEALGYRPPIVVGGGTVDDKVALYVGANSWSTDAMEGLRICQGLMRGIREPMAG